MIRVRGMMRCKFERDANYSARGKLGRIRFAARPAVGASVRLIRDQMAEGGIVGHVEHYPIEHPLPEHNSPLAQRTEPAIVVFLD